MKRRYAVYKKGSSSGHNAPVIIKARSAREAIDAYIAAANIDGTAIKAPRNHSTHEVLVKGYLGGFKLAGRYRIVKEL